MENLQNILPQCSLSRYFSINLFVWRQSTVLLIFGSTHLLRIWLQGCGHHEKTRGEKYLHLDIYHSDSKADFLLLLLIQVRGQWHQDHVLCRSTRQEESCVPVCLSFLRFDQSQPSFLTFGRMNFLLQSCPQIRTV